MSRLIRAPSFSSDSDIAQMAAFTPEQTRIIQAWMIQLTNPLRIDLTTLVDENRELTARLTRLEATVEQINNTVGELADDRNNRGNQPGLEPEVRQLRTDVNSMLEDNGISVFRRDLAALNDRLLTLEQVVPAPPAPPTLPPDVPVVHPSDPFAIVVDQVEENPQLEEEKIERSSRKNNSRSTKKNKKNKKKNNRKNAEDSDPSDGSSSSSDDSDSDSASSISGESDEYSASSEDERGGVFTRKKRSDFRRLKAIKPANREFRKLVDYRYYRLRDRRQKRSGKATKLVRRMISKMEVTLKDRKFDGVDKIKVLSFLSRFVREADLLGMSEAQAVLAIPSFLKGNASIRYEAANNVGTWPDTVQYFLLSYATDSVIEEAIRDLRDITQKSGEAEVDYSTRLTESELRCGNIHRWNERKLRFIDGLLPEIKPIVAQYNRNHRNATYWDLVEFAQSEGEAARARGGMRRYTPIPQYRGSSSVKPMAKSTSRRVYLMEPSDTATVRGSRAENTGESGELHLITEEDNSGSNPTTTTTTTVETIDATRIESEAEPVFMTDYYRRDNWVRPQNVPYQTRNMRSNRPGWMDNRNNPGPSRPPRAQPQPPQTRLFRYTCYQEGHISPDCPGQITAQTIIRNYESLPREILRMVPASSYWKARDELDAQTRAEPTRDPALPPPRQGELHPSRLPNHSGNNPEENQGKE